ncbi:MAG: LacI family DNA-binding transcriptional regulator [Armatimonadetes bacterium]|nr:LacI family DNA-binding transcriptional regulator [Armatimonadota bacterium]
MKPLGTDKKNYRIKRVRLADVAKEAGLSIQAVSHVLSGNESVRIPEATRIRVREAAKKVGYVPNRLARAMKTGKTKVIAIWINLGRLQITYVRMLQALSDRAKAEGYALMIISVDRDLAYKGEGPPPEFWPVDGVIALDAGKALRTFREDPSNDGTPVVVLAMEEYANGDTVGWDVYGGVRNQVERMIAIGKKRIVHLSPQWIIDGYPREQRRRGYTEAMLEAGLEPVIIPVKNESSDSAEMAMSEYLKTNPMPDCVVGFLDNLAVGGARAILNAGARIPEDCWVFGIGNYPEAADFRVPISSLQVPIDALIDQAWTWLLDRIGNQDQETRVQVLPMEFIERESTGRT